VDSYLQFLEFTSTSQWLSRDEISLAEFLAHVPVSSLRGLGGLHYRNFLMANMTFGGPGLFENARVLGLPGTNRMLDEASFRSIESHDFDDFNPEDFLRVRSLILSISSLLSLRGSYVAGQEARRPKCHQASPPTTSVSSRIHTSCLLTTKTIRQELGPV
jgi:hypothetical protein